MADLADSAPAPAADGSKKRVKKRGSGKAKKAAKKAAATLAPPSKTLSKRTGRAPRPRPTKPAPAATSTHTSIANNPVTIIIGSDAISNPAKAVEAIRPILDQLGKSGRRRQVAAAVDGKNVSGQGKPRTGSKKGAKRGSKKVLPS